MLQNDGNNEIYEKARATLIDKNGKPSPHYEAYMKYEEEWKNKRKAYDAAYENALRNPAKLNRWGVEGKLYIDDINSAMGKWITLGYKSEVENAIKILAVQTTDPIVKDVIHKAQNKKK